MNDPPSSPNDELQELRKKLALELLEHAETKHQLRSLYREFDYCNITYTRAMNPIHGSNIHHIFGAMNTAERLPDRFAPESKSYFTDLWTIYDWMQEDPHRRGDEGWQELSWRTDPRLDFTTWTAHSPEDWQCTPGEAHVQPPDPKRREFHLGSPQPLVPRHFDCRIEYTAWSDGNPCELSVVLGTPLVLQQNGRRMLQDPAGNSYCFAFGAYNNSMSVLQRSLRSLNPNPNILIQPGKKHRCVVEQLGGRRRLTVDGEVVFDVVEICPLDFPEGLHLSLYCSSAFNHFTDLTLSVRESSLTAEQWRMVDACRRRTLKHIHGGRDRYFDTRVMEIQDHTEGPEINLFFKDITQTVTEHLAAEKHKKAEEALREANEALAEKVAVRTRELNEALEKLRASEQRYALAGLGSNDGLWDWNLENNDIFFSPRWKQILGYTDHEVPNTLKAWHELIHPEDLSPLRQALENHFAGSTEKFTHEYRMVHKSGEFRWVLTRGAAIRDANGAPLRIAGSQSDITSRKQAELALQRDAMHDSLTGLPNRANFRMRVAEALHRRDTQQTPFAILFLDLDGFKSVNDNCGHAVGDQLLVAIAHRLEKLLRPEDIIARLGGDEFTILLNNTGGKPAIDRVANRILNCFEEPFLLGPETVTLGVSIGVALGRKQFKTPDEIIRKADSAMYHVKLAKKK